MNNEFKNYYKILGVTYDASFSNILRAAERELQYNRNNFLVQEAYYVLSDPNRRRQYDEQLRAQLSDREFAIGNATTASAYEAATTLYPPTPEEQKGDDEEQKGDDEEQKGDDEEQKGDDEEQKGDDEEQKGDDEEQKGDDEEQKGDDEEQKGDDEEQKGDDEEQKGDDEEQKGDDEEQKGDDEEQKDDDKKQGTGSNDFDYDDEPKMVPLNDKEKRNRIIGNIAIIGASLVTLGAPGALIASIIMAKAGRFKLYKQEKSKEKKIWGISTEESRLIKEANASLDAQVDQLLSSKHSNYDLLVAQAKYRNRIELLQKRIEVKMNQKIRSGGKLKYKMELIALLNQLETAKKQLQKVEDKLAERRINDDDKVSSLTEAYEAIEDNKAEIETTPKSNVGKIKNLQIQSLNLRKKKDKRVKKFKLTTKVLGGVKDGFMRVIDSIKSVKNIFTPLEQVYVPKFSETPDVDTPDFSEEELEEEDVKTR